MSKVTPDLINYAFSSPKGLGEYAMAARRIGLWKSEEIIFKKYLKPQDRILDVGCGAGRTTLALYSMGYKQIIGLDFCEQMIQEAISIQEQRNYSIQFIHGDATDLPFDSEVMDAVLFTFNGLMQIPGLENRKKAFYHINRVLKPGGIFIFTTHDMENDKEHAYYWKQEKELWAKGRQKPKLLEFGDLIYDFYGREMFVHVPPRQEILDCLQEYGFELIEDIYRPEICEESHSVKEFSDECRFWVSRKKAT